MQRWVKLAGLAGVLVVVTAAIFVRVPLVDYTATSYTANAGEITAGIAVGQTFKAAQDNLSEIGVMFATYSGRDNKQPVRFTLREFDQPLQVLRQGLVNPDRLGDNQFYRFKFKPIANASGKTFLFLIESPSSVEGDAVTVDIDTRDPYHLGSAFIIKETTNGLLTEKGINDGGKVNIDLAFSTYYQVPIWKAALVMAKDSLVYLKESWQDKRSLYGIWAKVAMQAVLLIVISWWAFLGVSSRDEENKAVKKQVLGWLVLLTVLGIVARLIYGVELPLTNDEGNYLYDARTLLEGKLAGGDGYVKAPLVVAWIALWQFIGGHTILAGRLSSILISTLTLWPIYLIAKELWGRKMGLCAATTWALLGVTTVFGIYVHTQPLAIFWGVAGVAVLLIGIRLVGEGQISVKNNLIRRGYWVLWGAGLLLGLGVISRKSILAVGLAVLLAVLIGTRPWHRRIKALLAVGIGFVLVVSLFLAAAWMVYGEVGVWEAVGYNSAEDGITAVDPAEMEQVRAYSLRGMTPFFRESLPLILLSMLGLGFAGERVLYGLMKKAGNTGGGWIVWIIEKIAWIVPLLIFNWAWSFFKEYEGSAIMYGGMWGLWWAMLGVMILFVLWPGSLKKLDKGDVSKIRDEKVLNISDSGESSAVEQTTEFTLPSVIGWVMPLAWLGGLVFFYMNWIKFHANYIGEFLPPLVILAGMTVPEVWRRVTGIQSVRNKNLLNMAKVLTMTVFTAVLFWALYVSGFVTFMFEHTGTFQLRSVEEAADWAKENIPMKEPIFTGAAAVPYLSGHHVSLDIAHPRWYAYEFTRKDTVRLNTFLPSAEEMLEAYRKADWFLHDQQTGFSFMMEYSEIEAGLASDWERVQGIENGSNTLTFYKRK